MSLRPMVLLLSLVVLPAHAGGGVEAEVGPPPMTVAEKLDFSREAVSEMALLPARVVVLLEKAKHRDDPEQAACLKSKLVSIRALVEIANRAAAAMRGAAARGDETKVGFEHRKVAIALSKCRQFAAEADGCVATAQATPGITDIVAEGPEADLSDEPAKGSDESDGWSDWTDGPGEEVGAETLDDAWWPDFVPNPDISPHE